MREDFFEQTMPMLFGKGTRGLVLDAGCGSGSYFPPLLRHFDRVIGIDFVPYRAKFAKSRHRDAEVLVASLTHIPLRDGCVDAVWTAVVLLHIKFSDKSIALREFQRCLRSSGILALWEPVLQGNGMRLKHKSIDYLATLDWWRNQLPLMVLASHDIPGFWTLISARFGGVTELDSRKLILSSST
jgi:ubiquinone/menaquinone biosynthesis C-methylase UbiE